MEKRCVYGGCQMVSKGGANGLSRVSVLPCDIAVVSIFPT